MAFRILIVQVRLSIQMSSSLDSLLEGLLRSDEGAGWQPSQPAGKPTSW